MAFTTKKVQTQTLGEYLLSSRIHLGFAIAEVAKLTRIQPKYILALEEGRYQDLPAAVYVQGFLKSLAAVYRLSAPRLEEQFFAEQQVVKNTVLAASDNLPSPFVMPRFIFSPRTLTIAAVGFLGLLSLGYLYFQISSLNRPPRLQISSPLADISVSSGILSISGKTEPDASVYLNNQLIVTDASGAFNENLSLGPGGNQLVIRAVNKFGKETTVTRLVNFQEKQIAGSFTVTTSTAQTIGGLSVEVVIAPNTAWIDLAADGAEQFSGTMLPNSRKIVTARNKIVLTTTNAGSTRIYLNGKDLGLAGKEGEILRDIEFTP